MAISTGDIKLIKSQTMDDVPEGGGAPVSEFVVDATSNSIYNDISEVDRAGGRVNLRKLFAGIRTNTVDGFYGMNIIVAEPPQDPNVSITLFTTGDQFDTRAAASSRMEAYLSRGATYPGYLFGDHVAGQMSVTLLQRVDVALPPKGGTIVLVRNVGLSNELSQYVRIADLTATVRTFTDASGDFQRMQVVLSISDQLLYDYSGFDALRNDSSLNYTGKTKTFDTVVADAARYYGVVPLEEPASINDFTVQAEGIYTQLVPSTRTESPIADARMNQQSAVLSDTGSLLTLSLAGVFRPGIAMYVGGSIYPGSLTLTRGGVTITDKAETLISNGTQVGTIDYDNGILALTTDLFGGSSTAHTVTYKPAIKPTLVNETLGVAVTREGQRLSYVVTLDPIPTRGTLQVSFRALGRWYVLNDDGSGAIRGSDSSFGAGTLNFSTGTMSITLGALPDVGSRVMLAWASPASVRSETLIPATGPTLERAATKTFTVPNGIKPGTLSITWDDGSAKTATDSNGALTGAATGAVYYASGKIDFRPNVLPAAGTVITVNTAETASNAVAVSNMTDGGSVWNFTLSAPIKVRSVEISVIGQYPLREYPGNDTNVKECIRIFDDGAGNLQVANVTSNTTIGSVNYTTGACSISKSLSGYKSDQPVFQNRTPLNASGDTSSYIKQTGYELRNVTLSILNGPGSDTISAPAWSWWAGAQANAAQVRFGGIDGAAGQVYTFTLDELTVAPSDIDFRRAGTYGARIPASFRIGTSRYVTRYNSTEGWQVIQDPSPATGEGAVVGGVVLPHGKATINSWPAGVSSLILDSAGATQPAVSGSNTELLVDSVTFRTAISPLSNGAFNVAGTWSDNTTFTATANNNGVIATGSAPIGETPGSYGVFGFVDFEMGVVDLRFGRRVPASMATRSDVIDMNALGVPGVAYIQSRGVQSDTLRYNAVGFSYIPLSPSILGLNPVRLPNDGRVPIFRPGGYAVVGHTGKVGPATVSNAQTVNCGRTRLSRVRVVGNDGLVIDSGYTANLDTGIVTFNNVAGYSQPITVEHRIEDMAVVSEVQIDGSITFTRPLTHEYPVPGSYVSSALVVGDTKARTSLVFDQVSWTNVWSDVMIGSNATATFNDSQNPITVTNSGALTERWACVFTQSTAFNVIGEHVGVIAVGSTGTDCAPMNPATGAPYFTIPSAGWGNGWSTGNVLRFNTVGAMAPIWVARTILPGAETVTDDKFTLLVRGDVDRP